MKTIAKKTIIIFLIINLILSNLNVGIFGLLAADVDAIFSYVDINFVDPTTEEEITKVDIGQNTKMNISFGVAGDVVTEKTSIRINLDNSNFYFSSFTPNGDTDNATYGVTSVDSNGNKKTLTAVLHINADGTRYITIDDLSQGDTVNMRLEGYFKDDTAPNEKLTVTVNNEEKASLAYTAGSGYLKAKSIIIIRCGIEIKNYEKAVSIIKDQLQQMLTGDFTEEDLESAKQLIYASVKSIPDTQDGELMYYFSQELSNKFVSLDQYIDNIKKVTKEEIIKIAPKMKINTIYFLTGEE